MTRQKKINLPVLFIVIMLFFIFAGGLIGAKLIGAKIERDRVVPLLNSSLKVMTEGNRGRSITLPESLPLYYVKDETIRQVRLYLRDDQVK